MKAYTPTEASSNTSSPVKTNFQSIQGTAPLTKFGKTPAPTANPHTRIGPAAFSTPMHAAAYGGAMSPAATHETRNAMHGVPHINMHPGGM
jgi:hypothetical protein